MEGVGCRNLLNARTRNAGISGAVVLCIVLFTHSFSSLNRTANNIQLVPVDLSQNPNHELSTPALPHHHVLASLPTKSETIELPDTVDQRYSVDNPIHWTPDWYETSYDLETLLMKRRDAIINRCGTLKKSKQYGSRYRSKGYHRETMRIAQRTTNCKTYKAGLTFWTSFGKTKPIQAFIPKHNMKFVVIRNPWHRIVSTWRDRFSQPNVKHFMRRFCRGKTWPSPPPFSVFVDECILANWEAGNHSVNSHWAPVIDKCKVCGDPKSMDFYIAQENMNLEASYMLTNYVGIMNASQLLPAHQDKVRRPTEGEKAGLSAQYQQEYTTLSSEQIDKLWQIYRYEIFLFDYPYSPFVDFSRA